MTLSAGGERGFGTRDEAVRDAVSKSLGVPYEVRAHWRINSIHGLERSAELLPRGVGVVADAATPTECYVATTSSSTVAPVSEIGCCGYNPTGRQRRLSFQSAAARGSGW